MTNPLSPSSAAAPSRLTNPFATCWTRPGTITFRFSEEQNAAQLVAKLAAQNWWGSIVGPHGSGKSTLLEALKPALAAAGRSVCMISLHNGQTRVPEIPIHTCDNCFLIIDGFEQLARLERIRIVRRCRAADAGLLVTSHSSIRISTLIRLSPDRRLVEQLVDDLCAKVSTNITSTDIAASHASHGSNVREIFFDLYDRHEQRRRQLNSIASAS